MEDKELGLDIYKVTSETMLEEMGASIGVTGCCSIVINRKKD